MANLRNLNEFLGRIQGISIKTTQGSFVKVEDLLLLLEEFQGEKVRQTERYKSFDEAKEAARNDPELLAVFNSKTPQAQRVAQEAFAGQSTPIASEGVKS